jgi:hypothetical protein
VAVVEGGSPGNAMGRSAKLTAGARARVFAVLVVVYGVPFVVALGLQRILARGSDPFELSLTPMVVQHAFAALCSCVQAVTAVVVYHALRSAKEGVGLDELLAVFD